MKKSAFTLAETLLTLAIIGIAAAMTIPSLINKFEERVIITKLKKFYSVLSQNYLFAVQEYGEVSTWGITERDAGSTDEEEDSYTAENAVLLRDKLFVNAQISKTCDNAKDLSQCGITKIYYINGEQDTGATGSSGFSCGLMLADGSSVSLMSNYMENRGSGNLSECYGLIYFDTNGYKGPNTLGKDVFVFIVTKQDITPEETINETTNPFEASCSSKGRGCTAGLLQMKTWII